MFCSQWELKKVNDNYEDSETWALNLIISGVNTAKET